MVIVSGIPSFTISSSAEPLGHRLAYSVGIVVTLMLVRA